MENRENARSQSITADELQNEYARLMFNDQKVIDENAFSSKEVARVMGMSESHAIKMCREKVESGEWERVWKRGSRCLVPAYRPRMSNPT